MSSSSRSAGTNLIGLLRNNNNSFEDDLQSESPERRAPRRSSLDSLHALAEFLPDDLLCDQQDGNVAATTFGSSSDPLLDMPMMTIDIDNPSNYNITTAEDEYFESTLSEPANYTSTNHPSRSRAQKEKPKRRASTDAFVNFHRMMGTSASANEQYGAPLNMSAVTRHDSMSSFTTASESISSNTGTGTGTGTNPTNQLAIPPSFAESMLKSSQSREQLDYMQRKVILQQQQRGGSVAVPTTAPSTTSAATLASPITPQKRRQLNPETVTLTAQFLSGKRPTLTSALEESRKQLKAYKDKVGCGAY